MSTPIDKYPTRLDGPGEVIPRDTAVIHTDPALRPGPLTPEQVSAYDEEGFLFFPSFFDPGTIDLLMDETKRLRMSERVRQSELAVTEPASGETRSIFAVHTVSALFRQLSRDQRILDVVRQLLGSEVYLHQSRLNLKPGFRGKEFYWHSDFETWHAEDGMPEMLAISCSIALTDNHEFNGPMMLIPGSHKHFFPCSGQTPQNHYQQSLKKQDFGVPSDTQLAWLVEQSRIEVPRGPAGSLVLFECNLMHGSNSNITPYPRTNTFFVFNSIENALVAPFAVEHERPWFLGNREPQTLEPVRFSEPLETPLAVPI